jgi:hypothetical protein
MEAAPFEARPEFHVANPIGYEGFARKAIRIARSQGAMLGCEQ